MKTITSPAFASQTPRFGARALLGTFVSAGELRADHATAEMRRAYEHALAVQKRTIDEQDAVIRMFGKIAANAHFPERDRILPFLGTVLESHEFPHRQNVVMALFEIFHDMESPKEQSDAILNLMTVYGEHPVPVFAGSANHWVG